MAETKKIATRESYGKGLKIYGHEFPNMVVLDADLAAATKTDIFREAYPDRHIDCGIAESNMMGIAAGLATVGKIPVASSFAMFAAGRAFEQVRNSIGYPHLNVKIGATHAGITVGEDGASHQCNEDMALMRSIPGMVVLCPADDAETKASLYAALKYEGPVYLRTGRAAVPMIYDNDYKFTIGKGSLLREGTDLTIVACGICVSAALKTAEILAGQGISAEVIDMCSVKPLDEEMLLKSAKKTKKVVTAEEHSIIGGLGSAVCDCLSEKYPVPVKKVGIMDVFGESGSAGELIKKYGLDEEGIYKAARELLEFE
ncbi:MAG: transketolase family protein [Clostridium sp.]|jgi:transketolase|nr:transketolase family protein [Clostridium sp.]